MAIETYGFSNGSWRKAKQIFVKSGGNWVDCKEVWTKSGGVWRQVFKKNYQFIYNIGTQYDFNLRNAALANGWDGNTPLEAILTVTGVLGASSTSSVAFNTDNIPAESVISLTINSGCYIVGAGGKGSSATQSGNAQSAITATPGQNGGPAMRLSYPVSIINNGTIGGGGGGGGGYRELFGKAFQRYYPGGGGAGSVGGAGGTYSGGGGSATGQQGSTTSGGQGGTIAGTGGRGGDLGQQGAMPSGASATYFPGSPGNAIEGGSYANFLVYGSVLGAIV